VTFATHTPTQVAVAVALETLGAAFYDAFRATYRARRDLLVETLRATGFDPLTPEGAYFVRAALGQRLGRERCRRCPPDKRNACEGIRNQRKDVNGCGVELVRTDQQPML
jgi:aspartate/methionine/tyrosine aminotransferase